MSKQALDWGKVSLRGGRSMGKGVGGWKQAMGREQSGPLCLGLEHDRETWPGDG